MRLSEMRIVLAVMFAAVMAGAVVLGIALTRPAPPVRTPGVHRGVVPRQVQRTAVPCRVLGSGQPSSRDVLVRCLTPVRDHGWPESSLKAIVTGNGSFRVSSSI